MPKKAKTQKEETFNWKGIKDNGDGTFDVNDKFAKKRLQREFRRQGIRSRSQRTGIKGFVVYPVGQRKQRARGMSRLPRKERQYYPGTKPDTRVRGIPGPRPQFRQSRPGFTPRPSYGTPPIIRSGARKGRGLAESVGGSIKKAAERRAQNVRESQRSPYTPEGKPRPGYQTYVDKTGTQRIVKMPTGKFSDRFASREQKTAVHEARVQESHKVESEMAERSKGQPSTRIPEKESERKVDHEERQQERVHHIQRTTELTKEQLGEQ